MVFFYVTRQLVGLRVTPCLYMTDLEVNWKQLGYLIGREAPRFTAGPGEYIETGTISAPVPQQTKTMSKAATTPSDCSRIP
jgi:hypothetical protein